jgi:DNA polymerase-4
VDMDAFFASVEALDDPSLAGRPLVVGGTGRRGVVASCSYEARRFGVRSAMPSAVARRLCPDAVFVPGRHERYAEVSRRMHDIFRRWTPLVEGVSLDEAFLDVTGALRLFGTPAEIARAVRDSVASELGLSCSVGAATVKFVAKLASEAAKPRWGPDGFDPGPGVVVVEPDRTLEFLHPHPISALWGVGPATGERLARLGIRTIGDLARVPRATLESAVGRAHGGHLADLAQGVDPRGVEPDRKVKSVGHEETYPEDRRDSEGLHIEVVRMADSVASRLRSAGLAGRTVTLKVRYGDFTTRTRSVTAAGDPLDTGSGIAAAASDLLAGVDLSPGVRLLGVSVSNLCPSAGSEPRQLALDFPAPGAAAAGHKPAAVGRRRAADAALDEVRRRFGERAAGPAALLDGGQLRTRRPGENQWGPSGSG